MSPASGEDERLITQAAIVTHLQAAGAHMDALYDTVDRPPTDERLAQAYDCIGQALAELAQARRKAGGNAALLDDLTWAEHDILRAQLSIQNLRAAFRSLEELKQ